MTETTAETETTEETAQDTPDAPVNDEPVSSETAEHDTESDATEGDEDDRGARRARAEAKKLRERLRDTEGERDTLTTTVDQLRKRIAENALETVLAKPGALWMTGVAVGDYFGEDDTLDVDKLHADARAAVRDHGIGAYRRFQGTADGGTRGGAVKGDKTWADLIADGRRK